MVKLENKLNGRYYYLLIQKDMFGDTLIIYRGGINHHRICHLAFDSLDKLHYKLERLVKLRQKRGYILVK